MRLIKLTIIVLFLPIYMSAQNAEVGVFAGITNYLGEFVGTDLTLKESRPAAGIFLRHHFNSKLAIRGAFNFGVIKGDDDNFDDNRRRDFSFKSSMYDLTGVIEYSFLSKYKSDEEGVFEKGFSPYIYAGFGLVNTNPSVTLANGKRLTKEELDASNMHISLPIGLGLKFDISERMVLGAEATLRATFSDYLDGLSESGNPDEDDLYWMAGLTLSYRFDTKK